MTAPLQARDTYLAKPLEFDPSNPDARLSYILDRLVEHENEWTDFEVARRDIAAAALARSLVYSDTAFFEVWHVEDAQPVGLVAFTQIVPQVNANFHFVFFDGKLRNVLGKRELLLRVMARAFDLWQLHRLSAEVPSDALALADFARKKLGFRYEGEGRIIKQRRARPHGHLKLRSWIEHTPSAWDAGWGSRKYQAIRRRGRWLDLVLLSVTCEEFDKFLREASAWGSSVTQSLSS